MRMTTIKHLRLWTLVLLLGVLPLLARRQPGAQAQQKASSMVKGGATQQQRSQLATVEPDYVIGPEDVLDVSVWEEPRFSRTVPVRPDGKISLPLLNDIQAAGLTPMRLAASITEMLRKYVAQPQVTVTVITINSRRVYVLGEVAHPGPMPLLPSMTVLQAIANAGGFTQFANEKTIYVLRDENGKQNRYPFNYKEAIRGGPLKQNIVLKAGDTIVVP